MRRTKSGWDRCGGLVAVVVTLAAWSLPAWSSPALAVVKDTSPAIDREGSGLTIEGLTLEPANVDRSARVYSANIADCRSLLESNPRLEFQWQLRSSPTAGSEYAIKYRRGSQVCELGSVTDDADSECEVPVSSQSLDGRTVRYSIRARELLGVTDAGACEGEERTADVYFVFTRQTASTTGESVDSDRIRLRLATRRPPPPGAVEVSPGETSLRVSWEEPSEADNLDGYVVYYHTAPFDLSAAPETVEDVRRRSVGTVTSATLTQGIELGNTYWIAVTSRNRVLNESVFSESQEVTTVEVEDFWRLYRSSGGVEEGGYCAAAPLGGAAPGMLLVLLGLCALRRRAGGEA